VTCLYARVSNVSCIVIIILSNLRNFLGCLQFSIILEFFPFSQNFALDYKLVGKKKLVSTLKHNNYFKVKMFI